MTEKKYQLEMRLSIVEVDEHGRSSYNGRFELSDTIQLGARPLPSLLEVMGSIHQSVKSIGEIAARD